jgi:hypothetical protein
VSVTFAPSGRVTTASVPPFSGGPVTVHKSFSIQ